MTTAIEEEDVLDDDRDSCICCSEVMPQVDLLTCDGCGNALCRSCADEDDFGNVRCDPGCGAA